MATPLSVSSPSTHYPQHNEYLSSLDFLSLAGLDGTPPAIPSPQVIDSTVQQSIPPPQHPLQHQQHQPQSHLLQLQQQQQQMMQGGGGLSSLPPHESVGDPGPSSMTHHMHAGSNGLGAVGGGGGSNYGSPSDRKEAESARATGSGKPRGRPPKRASTTGGKPSKDQSSKQSSKQPAQQQQQPHPNQQQQQQSQQQQQQQNLLAQQQQVHSGPLHPILSGMVPPDMEIDQAAFQDPQGNVQHLESLDFIHGSPFDAANLLQQQLEHIHMQSPLFDPNNPQAAYHNQMAQLFLASPVIPQGPSSGGPTPPAPMQSDHPMGESLDQEGKRWAPITSLGGILTPGPSGEMVPELRMDMMSPMQLELLVRGEIDAADLHNVVPLLSPALTQHPSGSTYASPANHAAFGGAEGQGGEFGQVGLEQLQQQQRQFQEQLAILQQQQRQLEASAIVGPSNSTSTSPYQTGPGSTGRPAITPGVQSTGSINTPSPGYFSPLTSPALEASMGGRANYGVRPYSPSVSTSQHQVRPPHPLSALSSPALNPVGSSGGAQQTLSPALGPQNASDMADPDYIATLQGMLEANAAAAAALNAGGALPQNTQAYYGPTNPAPGQQQQQGSTTTQSPLASPAITASVGGPHRGSLPPKSRPSPMMKPSLHRSHSRHASGSVPASPMYKFHNGPASGLGSLPPAAIDQRGVLQHQQQQQALQSSAASTSSTPSPVDLSAIMPPPPVPATGPKSLKPMTPASLMNLKGEGDGPSMAHDNSSGSGAASGSRRGSAMSIDGNGAAGAAALAPPVRAAAKKATAVVHSAQKRGSRLVPAGGAAAAKRALAIRPPGGVGVRTATKGAAAAAAAVLNPEPEARKTSHKAAEQKRRDSLKAGFDELRLLLPAINVEALDPESGEPIPGSSAPRLLPKSSLVPDDNPNRGVSKVALLKFSNEYIVRLHSKVEKRDGYIDRLRDEIRRLRGFGDPSRAHEEIRGDEGEDLLDMEMLDGEEDDLGGDEDEEEPGDMDLDGVLNGSGVDGKAVNGTPAPSTPLMSGKAGSSHGSGTKVGKSPALGPTKRPSLSHRGSSSATVTPKSRKE